MTEEEIINKLQTIKRDTPLEINLSDGNRLQIEFTTTDEYIVNYFDHQKIFKSLVFPKRAEFTMFLREQFDKKLL
jgi:hypothetical protein